MADQVDVKIVTVDAVDNLAQLKKAIKDAKDNLATLDLGSKKYQEQLSQVIEGQNLLRAAMNGTTATAEHLKDAIDKEGTSYNSLVNQMANLKRAFRATTDEAERANLAGQIKDINDQLKALDEMQGSYVRNVGDYFNQTSKAIKDVVKDLPSGLDKIKGPLKDIDGTMGLMSKQPILGILGLLAPLITEIASGIKESDTAMAGVKKMMDALKPVMDFFSGILQDIVEYVGDLIGQAASFLSSNGIFQKVIQGVMGVGNAILKFVVAPFKGVIEAIKVFKEQGVKGLGDAARAFGNEMKNGVAFRENFNAGTAFADTIVKGAKSKSPGREVGKAIKEDLEKELTNSADLEKIWEKAVAAMIRKMQEQFREEKEKDDLIKEVTEMMDAEMTAEIDAYLEGERVMYETSVKMAEEAAKKKMAVMNAYASGTSDLLNGLADLMESQGSEDEKTVKATKNLRIAAATIDMIQGAVTAFSTAQQLGPIAGPIVGALNAATVVASGLANIAKIKSTNISKDSAPSTSPETPSASAPVLETAIPTTTVTEGASQEMRLNRATEPQKVYILQDDIEAAGDASRVQVEESSF